MAARQHFKHLKVTLASSKRRGNLENKYNSCQAETMHRLIGDSAWAAPAKQRRLQPLSVVQSRYLNLVHTVIIKHKALTAGSADIKIYKNSQCLILELHSPH
eukprot:6205868-Pleurochrysis_carterae.AAC.2